MRSKKINFTNKLGYELSARLDMPDDREMKSYIIFAHCFTCSKNFNAVRNISKALTEKDFGVFRFDFTGLGESEGDFEDTNFTSNVEDLMDAAEFVRENYGIPRLMMGHSLGGAATVCAANQLEFVSAYATIGAPASPGHVGHFARSHAEEIKATGKALVNIGGRPFTVKQQFLDDVENQSLAQKLHNSEKPILIFHSPQDEIVSVDNAAELYKLARHPKSFVSLDGADHMLTNKADSEYVGNVTASWAQRYL